MNHIYIGDRELDPPEDPDLPTRDCGCCRGTGRIEYYVEGEYGHVIAECPDCDGEGQVEMTDAERRQKAFDDFDPPDQDFG